VTPPTVSIVAKSGTGKTTLLVKLIAELKSRGYRVGAIKHDAHDFEIDHEGKDSWRFTRAGADATLISSRSKLALVRSHAAAGEPSVQDTVARYLDDMDIVLTEGFKRSGLPKIEVFREAWSDALLCGGSPPDPTLVAVVTDANLQLDVPRFGLEETSALCDFLVQTFLTDPSAQPR